MRNLTLTFDRIYCSAAVSRSEKLPFFQHGGMVKFLYSEKVTKFCEILPLLLTAVHTVKSKGKISQNLVAFSEYMNFKLHNFGLIYLHFKITAYLVDEVVRSTFCGAY